ncbi:hypothetical protein [Faecalibacterium prausnitzii]|uniref:hypothetical protein n=1 Tax=Faecalibacterium prausnitzii TaxID=853 RepID=UPI001651DE23|nr:hypothetical protein [Faecalibacterium prausnitzii]
MMKLTALKIDPEFQGKIPPLTLVLNSIHSPDEQTNKAHRQIDGELYFMLDF